MGIGVGTLLAGLFGMNVRTFSLIQRLVRASIYVFLAQKSHRRRRLRFLCHVHFLHLRHRHFLLRRFKKVCKGFDLMSFP